MIAIWMLYVSAVSFAFGLAALALERAARLWARPRRFAWALAIAASLLVPLAGLMIPSVPAPRPVAQVPTRTGALPVGPVPTVRTPPAGVSSALSRIGPLIAALNRPLLVLWGGASLALALGLLRAGIGLRRRARGWRPAVVDGTEVMVAPDLGPAVVRLGGLKVVLPEWALAAEPSARSLMLLHENEHREARDPDLLLGATVALVLVPWALPLWWQVRRLQLAVETDCDRRVMRAGADAHAYGVLLLSVGARSIRQPLLAPTAFSEQRSLLERRIEAMTCPTTERRLVRTALAVGVGALSVAAACKTPRPAPAPEPAQASREVPPGVYREQDVATRPEYTGGPKPKYPDLLRAAGVEGRVVVQFIVDTAGHVEPASVRIVSSTRQEFEAPTREAIAGSTFRPGLVQGRAVRVQVTQPVNFQTSRAPDSTHRLIVSNPLIRDARAALRAQDYPRADSLLGLAQREVSGPEAQTVMFYRGVAQFQRGYAAIKDAQSKVRDAEKDPAVKASACASVASAGDFLNQAEPNLKAGTDQEAASALLNFLPQLRTTLPQLARTLSCPP